MRYLYILILSILYIAQGYGQTDDKSSEEFYKYKNQLGINFTNILGNVLSLNPNNANSPYGITYRRHFGKWSFRSAFNINVENLTEDDFENGDFFIRKLMIVQTNSRLGLEKHMKLSPKMMFSYGFDILVDIDKEHSEIETFQSVNSVFKSDEFTYGFGAGPVIRLEYKISDRLFLSTESSFYGNYSINTKSIEINGQIENDPKTSSTKLKLELPQSIFFNISF